MMLVMVHGSSLWLIVTCTVAICRTIRSGDVAAHNVTWIIVAVSSTSGSLWTGRLEEEVVDRKLV